MSVLYKYKCRIPTVQLSYTNGISVLYHRYMMLFLLSMIVLSPYVVRHIGWSNH